MSEVPDELEKLLTDVRKTINDNRLFLDRLVDEAIEADPDDEPEVAPVEDEFEEL